MKKMESVWFHSLWLIVEKEWIWTSTKIQDEDYSFFFFMPNKTTTTNFGTFRSDLTGVQLLSALKDARESTVDVRSFSHGNDCELKWSNGQDGLEMAFRNVKECRSHVIESKWISHLTSTIFHGGSRQRQWLQITVPKIGIESKLDGVELLKLMGVNSLFDSTADLTKVIISCPNLAQRKPFSHPRYDFQLISSLLSRFPTQSSRCPRLCMTPSLGYALINLYVFAKIKQHQWSS